jgi:hypothetical protein
MSARLISGFERYMRKYANAKGELQQITDKVPTHRHFRGSGSPEGLKRNGFLLPQE